MIAKIAKIAKLQSVFAGFNSKLVRLEGEKLQTCRKLTFGFNSKLVRLEGNENALEVVNRFEVLIPNWCD